MNIQHKPLISAGRTKNSRTCQSGNTNTSHTVKQKNYSSHIQQARHSLAQGNDFHDALTTLNPYAIGVHDVLSTGGQLQSMLNGLGPTLHTLINDSSITDILINGNKGVWIDRGKGLERDKESSQHFTSKDDVRALAVRLAAACGQRLDDSSPIVDGTFPGGLRLHAVLPPLCSEGALISLRTQRSIVMNIEDLEKHHLFSPALRPLLEALIHKKANVIISGATGSGKTTLLAALLALVPENERILVIEESAELRPRHEHIVHLQVRHANVQGVGEISMSELVRAAMRMRPDRIVLGECRGAEVRDVLSALNTGHEGGWATIHANSALDVPARLVALGALADMAEHVVAAQATSALDAVIHVERSHEKRFIRQIAILERKNSELTATAAIECNENGTFHYGPAWPILAQRLGFSEDELEEQTSQKKFPKEEQC
ncbi:MAG: TadA family conjugal transfer-associated ATPase [Actinomycetaceae bacterium]|nr:TadA family conjugal transfer-associated ATPase [Actinomycetaceae bacterium]